MKLIAVICVMFFGQGADTLNINPQEETQGKSYQQILNEEFGTEEAQAFQYFGLESQTVIIYDQFGGLVAQAQVNFYGELVETQDESIKNLLDHSKPLMELENTRYFIYNK